MSNIHATLKLTSNILGNCDLVVKRRADGKGRLALTNSILPAILIALNSDRRADRDDVIPPLQTMREGITAPFSSKRGVEGKFPFGNLNSRRGWCGDFMLEKGYRAGSKLWLLARGKKTLSTQIAAQDYAQEAIQPIADYHKTEIEVLTGWDRKNKEHLLIDVKLNHEKLQMGRSL